MKMMTMMEIARSINTQITNRLLCIRIQTRYMKREMTSSIDMISSSNREVIQDRCQEDSQMQKQVSCTNLITRRLCQRRNLKSYRHQVELSITKEIQLLTRERK
jgi:hypothetical protein